jgi:predicted DNA-binding protein
MSQVVSLRLTDELYAELDKRAKAQAETIGVYLQEALKKFAESEAPSGTTVEMMKELMFIRASLYLIAEHAQGGAFIPKDLLTKIYQAAKQGSQQKIDARTNGDAVMRGSVSSKATGK